MCGLIGYAAPAHPVSAEALARGRDAMVARGPDGAGLWRSAGASPAAALAHRRLAVVDLSAAGHQPMLSPCGRYALVYNGELYEHDALRAAAAGHGARLRGRSDTEALLHLLIHEGRAALERLNGMFALAFWDDARGELLLARDRFGEKPLYVRALPGGGVAFASALRALLAADLAPLALDPQAHSDLLALTYTPGPATALRGVEQLGPGEWLRWRAAEGASRGRFWAPRLAPAAPPPPARGLAAAAAWLRADLTRAVRERLVADVPVGLMLSGGLDSSALLWAASEAGARELRTFTVSFGERGFDESGYAREVAAHFGARHHEERVSPRPEEFMDPLMDALDAPFADSSAIPLWYLCRAARREVTVALGGDGGDELLAGYGTHLAGELARLYRLLPSPLRALARQGAEALPVRHGKVSLDLKLRQFTRAAEGGAAAAHFGFKEFLPAPLRAALLAPLAARAREEGDAPPSPPLSPLRLFAPHFEGAEGAGEAPLHRALRCDQRLYLPDNILVKADRVSMGHSLELRAPFLDFRLADALNALPPSLKLRAGTGKVVLRHALEGRVPPAVTRRRKQGFNVPMAAWLSGPLRPLCDDLLSAEMVGRAGLWDPRVVDLLRREHATRAADHSRALWAMLCFMGWWGRVSPARAGA
ncbi:MAG: asparagine synthase (glutamine-hydrolyzing) [Deltaproteobacteria bacterium]|nr:asparagine synthase (glutamine-hydrolyzing) [Deltaproteobacteria bacterium]